MPRYLRDFDRLTSALILQKKRLDPDSYDNSYAANFDTTTFVKIENINPTFISISSEPESSISLWMTTQLTLPSCRERVCIGNMVSRFQT